MTDVNATLPTALRRALELFADPPAQPDISKGYLDLLGEPPAESGWAVPKNTSDPGGVGLADRVAVLRQRASLGAKAVHILAASRRVVEHPTRRNRVGRRLRSRQRYRVAGRSRRRRWPRHGRRHIWADAGTCGPGQLGAAGRVPQGRRAAVAATRRHRGCNCLDCRFAADTEPRRGDGGDGASTATGRANRSDGAHRRRPGPFWRLLPNTGAHFFGDDELGDILEDNGFVRVRTKNVGGIQWVRGQR